MLVSSAQAVVIVQANPEGKDGLYIAENSEQIYSGGVDGFAVSPNGYEVVFTPKEGEENGWLNIYNLVEETTETLLKPDESGMRWSQVRFAPSGEQIIGRSEGGIYSVDTDGTHVRRLVADSGGAVEWPVMSADGYLAYLKQQDLYVVDLVEEVGEIAETHLLASHTEYESPTSRPSFKPGSHLVLYPTNEGSAVFNAETGEEETFWPFISGPLWWETSGNNSSG